MMTITLIYARMLKAVASYLPHPLLATLSVLTRGHEDNGPLVTRILRNLLETSRLPSLKDHIELRMSRCLPGSPILRS